jgi:MscS family membrane protein
MENLTEFIILLAVVGLIALGIRFFFTKVVKSRVKKIPEYKLDDIINVLKNPIFLTIILGGIYFALPFLDVDLYIKHFGRNALVTAGALVWTVASFKSINILTQSALLRMGVKILTLFGLTVITFVAWGINVTPLLASAGIIGIALTVAGKDIIANLVGGVSIMFDKPYQVGDYVVINEQYRGEVIEIGMRSTKIRTRDNMLITAPNSLMVNEAVVNETGLDPQIRIRIPIGVAYGTDLAKVETVLLFVMGNDENILDHPKPVVRYRQFGDSAVELEVMGTIKNPELTGRVTDALIREIDRAFKSNKIEIPFPQRDVHIKGKNK